MAFPSMAGRPRRRKGGGGGGEEASGEDVPDPVPGRKAAAPAWRGRGIGERTGPGPVPAAVFRGRKADPPRPGADLGGGTVTVTGAQIWKAGAGALGAAPAPGRGREGRGGTRQSSTRGSCRKVHLCPKGLG